MTLAKRPLGSTGIDVSCLGLGTVKFGRNQEVKYPTGFALPVDRAIEVSIRCRTREWHKPTRHRARLWQQRTAHRTASARPRSMGYLHQSRRGIHHR